MPVMLASVKAKLQAAFEIMHSPFRGEIRINPVACLLLHTNIVHIAYSMLHESKAEVFFALFKQIKKPKAGQNSQPLKQGNKPDKGESGQY